MRLLALAEKGHWRAGGRSKAGTRRMKLVLASNNKGKLAELQALFAPLGVELVRQADLGIPEAPEPHRTFIENALAKARHAAQVSGLPALADDAGPVRGGLWRSARCGHGVLRHAVRLRQGRRQQRACACWSRCRA